MSAPTIIAAPSWVWWFVLATVTGSLYVGRVQSVRAAEAEATLTELRRVASTCDAELVTAIGLNRRVAGELKTLNKDLRAVIGGDE